MVEPLRVIFLVVGVYSSTLYSPVMMLKLIS
ncbi:Uncharacterised protein [Segatella copri]|nr:Uncharacterised protein [Segatella copri]